MEGLAPSRMKEETTNNGVGAINVGALTILGTFGYTNRRKRMVINLDLLVPYKGTARDKQP
jgi:hypothetical protein